MRWRIGFWQKKRVFGKLEKRTELRISLRTPSGSAMMLRGSQALLEMRHRCLGNNALLITPIFLESNTGTVFCDLHGKSMLNIWHKLSPQGIIAPVSACPLAAPSMTHSKSDRTTETYVDGFEDKYPMPRVDTAWLPKQCKPAQAQLI